MLCLCFVSAFGFVLLLFLRPLCGYFVNWNDKLTAVTATTTATIIITIEVVGGNQRETIEIRQKRGKFSAFFCCIVEWCKIGKKAVQIFDSQS